MRRIPSLPFAPGAVSAATPALWSGTARAEPPGWTVAEATVPVFTRSGPEVRTWQPVQMGDVIEAADEVMTFGGGTTVLTRAEDVVHAEPNGDLELSPPEPDTGLTRIVQNVGRALFEVDAQPEWQFEVETPYLTAVVTGTEFVVDEQWAVIVNEGRVSVFSAEDRGGDGVAATAGRSVVAIEASGGISVEVSPALAASLRAAPVEAPAAWPARQAFPSSDPVHQQDGAAGVDRDHSGGHEGGDNDGGRGSGYDNGRTVADIGTGQGNGNGNTNSQGNGNGQGYGGGNGGGNGSEGDDSDDDG